MDVRLKTFADEVATVFGPLEAKGFGKPVVRDESSGRRVRIAEMRSGDSLVEVSLVLGYAGEEEVTTILQSPEGRIEVGVGSAHTGHQIGKAIRDQYTALVRILVGA